MDESTFAPREDRQVNIRDRIVELRRVPASALQPNPKNWRTHPAKQKAALSGLLKEIGYADALLARELPGGQLQLVDGHLRKETTPNETVPVLVLDLTEAEADKLLATLDPLAGWAGRDDGALKALLATVATDDAGLAKLLQELGKDASQLGATDPDTETQPEDTDIKLGELFELGAHRLMCGDSTKLEDVAALLNGEKPNLMATDPPYGVNYDPAWRERELAGGARSTGKVSNDDQADWTGVWKLFPGNVAYVWCASLHSPEVAASLQIAGFELRYLIIWNKQHFSMSRGHYHWMHEPCWYGVRKGGEASWMGDRKQVTVWDVQTAGGFGSSKGAADESTGHGTQKPVELFKRPMLNHTAVGASVFEPFSGSGSCIIAGEQLGRRVYAMEIDPRYVAAAVKRWEQFTGKKAVRHGR
jgi:DNA modification methylase